MVRARRPDEQGMRSMDRERLPSNPRMERRLIRAAFGEESCASGGSPRLRLRPPWVRLLRATDARGRLRLRMERARVPGIVLASRGDGIVAAQNGPSTHASLSGGGVMAIPIGCGASARASGVVGREPHESEDFSHP